MEEIVFDDITFDSDEQLLGYLNKTTNSFDLIDFYNSDENIKAFILITPTQTVAVYPIRSHKSPADTLYKLFYGMNCGAIGLTNEKTNNILISLVGGEICEFHSIVPKTVTTYQFNIFSELIDTLKDYISSTDFAKKARYSQIIFQDTYRNSMDKLKNLQIDDDVSSLIPEKYQIEKRNVKK